MLMMAWREARAGMPDCWSVSYVRYRESVDIMMGSTVSLHQFICLFITVNGHSISDASGTTVSLTGRAVFSPGWNAPALTCKPASGPCCLLLGSRYPDPRSPVSLLRGSPSPAACCWGVGTRTRV